MKSVNALRFFPTIRSLAFGATGIAAIFAAPTAQAKSGTGTGSGAVTYSIARQIVQGDMPLSKSYTLQITSPATLPVGTISLVTLNTSLITSPAGSNITTAQALGFVTITPLETGLVGGLVGSLPLINQITSLAPVLTFTGPNQTLSVTVNVNIPQGDWAGSFGYETTTSGWPTGLTVVDPGAFINVTATQAMTTTGLPLISVNQPVDQSVYVWVAGGPALIIPYTFIGNTQDGSPLLAMNGSVTMGTNPSQDLGISPIGLGTANATATGNFSVSAPGVYTISANDANGNGTASASVQITVQVQAGPPTVVINSPDPSSTFVMSGNEVDIPFTFTGTSQYGGVIQLTATLDGNPVTITPSGYGNLVATGTGTLPVTSAGDHILAVTCTDGFGTATTSENLTVTVQAPQPPPTVVINTPAPNATFTYTTGGPAVVVPFTFTGSSTGGPITALTATMDGNPVTFTTSGLNTVTANGTASLSFTSGGNHTLAVTATNNGGTASASEVINIVTQTPQTSTLNVAITAPAANTTYTLPANGSPLTIADAFTSNSTATSGVTSLTVTFNGTPVSVTTSTLGQPTVTANGSLVVSTPGVYTLAAKATDQFNTATTSENITVNAPAACPKITIVKPCDGAQYTVGTSSCPLWVQVSVTGNTTTGYTLGSFTLTLNGQPVTYTTLTGLNTISANGTVSLKITATGTYTLVATTTSGGVSATDTNTFKVVAPSSCGGGEDGGWGDGHGGWSGGSFGGDDNDDGWGSGFGSGNNGGFGGGLGSWGNNFGGGSGGNSYCVTPPPCNVNWQQSWSCNTTQKGGSTLPLCFQVQYTGSSCLGYWSSYFNNCGSDYFDLDNSIRNCWNYGGALSCFFGNVPSSQNCLNNSWDNISGGKYSHDNTVQVVCYEVKSNGSCGTPTVYTCGGKNNCAINHNDQYSCNFATSTGKHTYRCDVYCTNKSNGNECFLGSQQFCTK